MKLTEIKRIAHDLGIRTSKLNKKDIIHRIQMKEQNTPCFDRGENNCIQYNCLWRDDCLK